MQMLADLSKLWQDSRHHVFLQLVQGLVAGMTKDRTIMLHADNLYATIPLGGGV